MKASASAMLRLNPHPPNNHHMKQFRLEKSTTASHSALSRFYVFNAAGDIIGSINVEPNEEADLLAHWRSSSPAPAARAAASQNLMVKAMTEAARKHPLSQQAILRGC